MRNKFMILAAFILLTVQQADSQELALSKDGSLRNIDIRDLAAENGRMYLATKNELYAAAAEGERWESIFFIPSSSNEIQCVSQDQTGGIYIGTRRGLFSSHDSGLTWKNIFRTIITSKSSVISMAVSRDRPSDIVIGTGSGIFASDDAGRRWRNISGILKNQPIHCILISDGLILAAASDGLYISDHGSYNWNRTLDFTPADGSDEEPVIDDDDNNAGSVEEPGSVGIKSIALYGSRIYVATGKKIRFSDDRCRSWKDCAVSGLGGLINHIAVSGRSGMLYSATTKGVFAYIPDKSVWVEIYKGAGRAINVKTLLFADETGKRMWAASDKGLYKIEVPDSVYDSYADVEKSTRNIALIFAGEPDFKELQQAAMRFNEVSPDKIKRWRTQAQLRALVPKISLGFDNSRSNTYEIYTSATKDYVISGPDDINEGFDVSVSWDLANLVWSDDQTSIDVRSRLTTQLRNDILDDLRRAYYERKRLQFESMSSPSRDLKLQFERELRIKELTQVIDDLTGNYLSDHMDNANQEIGRRDL